MQALAAEGAAGLDQHGVEAQVGGAEGRGVAAGPAAQDDEIHFAGELAHDHGRASLPLEEEALGSLEEADEIGGEAGRLHAVDDPVVEGE